MKRKIAFIIVCLVLGLLITIITFSYAFFAINTTPTNTMNVNVTVANGVVANFTVQGNGDMNVSVSGANMLSSEIGSVAGTNTQNLNVTLISDTTVTCVYDMYFSWNNNSDSYTKTTGATNELTISGTDNLNTLNEVQVPNSGNSLKLGSFYIRANASTVTKTWNITANFYNLNINQDAHADKTYLGKVDIRNAVCFKTENEYVYTGYEEAYIIPITGYYSVKVWGAQGGNNGGKGGYSEGLVYLNQNDTVYINVGNMPTGLEGGYNGGGTAKRGTQWGSYVGGGGGATSIAKSSGTLKALGQASKQSDVIIVAGGGGGRGQYIGGVGGGLEGTDGGCVEQYPTYRGFAGTQSAGGSGGAEATAVTNGSFGQGGSATGNYGGVAGGGGYYGGSACVRSHCGAGGGSGYIGGTSSGNTYDGASTIPTHDGSSTTTGNAGNGYAKIAWQS